MKKQHRSTKGLAPAALAVAALAAATLGAVAVHAGSGDELLRAQVTEVQQKEVRLNRGSDAGVKERQVFDVFHETRTWSLPLTAGKADLKVARSVVARVVVYKVEKQTCLAHVFDEKDKAKVEAGQFAVLNPGAIVPEQPVRVRGHSPPGTPQVAWRAQVEVRLDVDLDPWQRAFYEWHAADGGTFLRGSEVAPATFRTATPENVWIAPWSKKKCEATVRVIPTSGKPTIYPLSFESTGAAGARASQVRVKKILPRTRFEGLRDVAFDAKGTCFYLDGAPGALSGDEFLRSVSPDGADLGAAKVQGHDFAAVAVNERSLYFLDLKDGSVKRYGRNGSLLQILASDPLKIGGSGDGNGRFKDPVDLALGPDGALYVLDAGQRCVHRFDPDGAFVHSFGKPGDRELELKAPTALAVAPDGTVYVVDNGRKRAVVYRDARARAEIELGKPNEEFCGIAVDPFGGTVHVLEKNVGSVRRFSAEGTLLATIQSSPDADVAGLRKPSRLRIDATRLLHVVDREGASLARFDAGERGDFAGRQGGEKISTEVRIAASPEGDVILLDKDRCTIYRFDPSGWITARMSSEGSSTGQGFLKTPMGVGVGTAGEVYVVDAKKAEISKFQAKGGALLKCFPGDAYFQKIRNLQMSSQREKLVVLMDREDKQISIVNPQSFEVEASFQPSSAFENPVLATFAGRFDKDAPKSEQGYFWVVDDGGERVQWLPWNSRSPNEVSQKFDKVTGIAATVSGLVLLCDQGTRTLEVYAANGQKLTSLQAEELVEPSDVGSDDLGRVYVFDKSKDGRILVLSE